MKAGVVDNAGCALASISLPTEAFRGQDFGLARMCEAIHGAAAAAGLRMSQISGIGVATPGTMDIPAGIMIDPPNLRPWQNVPVRDHVQKQFGLPTAFQNDANAAAYGEFWAGAGKTARSLVMFTLGTGVGGGIVIGDRVLEGEHSHGAELGHTRIETANPRQCGCGRWGCLEAYASATSVVKRAQEAMERPGARSILSSQLEDGGMTARDVFGAAASGDALAHQLVDETALYLAIGAVNVMHTVDPDVVVFGGGMIATGDWFLEMIQKYVCQLAFPIPAAKTTVCYAQLGTDAGFIGAAGCARLLCRQRCGTDEIHG